MKYKILIISLLVSYSAYTQNKKAEYPKPEFKNEIYYFNKNDNSLVRLEKGNSGLNTRLKLGGFAGGESSFVMEKEKSPVRLPEQKSLSFVFYTGTIQEEEQSGADTTPKQPPPGFSNLEMMNDPSRTTSLYNASVEKDSRAVILQSGSGMKLINTARESRKYTFSEHEVRPGYYELDINKPLPKGEYVFVVMGGYEINLNGSATLFAFGVD